MESTDFTEAKVIILDIDTLHQENMDNNLPEIQKLAENLNDIINRLIKCKYWTEAGVCLKILAEFAQSHTPVFGGIRIEENIFGVDLNDMKKKYYALCFKRAKKLKEIGESKGQHIPHVMRERYLEGAIRIAREAMEAPGIDADEKTRLMRFISACYLQRSRYVLPKGEKAPPKKVEALKKAWEYIEKQSDPEAAKLKAEIALEASRFLSACSFIKKEDVERVINEALVTCRNDTSGYQGNSKESFFWQLLDHTIKKKILSPDDVPEAITATDIWSLPAHVRPYASLFLTRYWMLNSNAKMKDSIKPLIASLKGRLYVDPLWDDVVLLLEAMGANRCDAAIQCWEICEENEERHPLPVQIRAYWPHLVQLYNMAFRDALEPQDKSKAICIADSSKGKVIQKMIAIEETMGGHSVVGKMLKNYYGNIYDPDYEENKKQATERQKSEPLCNYSLPPGWAAVHFYLTEQNGYAVVKRSPKEGTGYDYERHEFSVESIHQAFVAWNSIYHAKENIEEADLNKALEILVLEAGKGLSFLKDIPEENLLFIPHGFLHQVPLHAVKIEDKYLFEIKSCLYLPAFRMAADQEDGCIQTRSPALFMHLPLERSSRTDYDKAIINLFDNWQPPDQKKDDASAEELVEYLSSPGHLNQELVTILCHGQANPDNPFLSVLKLKEDVTYFDLREKLNHLNINLTGKCIILGACESDMAPISPTYLDEHLSLSTIFLERKASYVIGNLWVSPKMLQKEVIECLVKDFSAPHATICKLQKNWKNDPDMENLLFNTALYRVFGTPQPSTQNEDSTAQSQGENNELT